MSKVRVLSVLCGLVLAGVLLIITAVPGGASPTTVYVRIGGNDTYCNGTANVDYGRHLGVPPNCAVRTIEKGISLVASGGTVYVAAGTYNENQITISKSLDIQGAGSATTIIDGGDALLTTNGLVNITANGTVTFQGFTVRNAGGPSNGGDGADGKTNVGIYTSASSGSPILYTLTNNVILGTNNPNDSEDYGFYGYGGSENLVFTYNQISQTGANPILFERHYGPTDVSYNTFDRGVADGGNDAYFNMNYGGTNITSLQKVSHNTINMGNDVGPFDNSHRSFGITFASDFNGGSSNGGFTNVQVTDNTIQNLKAYRRGIGLWNNAPSGNGAYGDITAVITGNTITGTGAVSSMGIRLLGLVTSANIRRNSISNVDDSFLGAAWNSNSPIGANVNFNKFTNDITGLHWQGTGTLDATNNWWGCASGPNKPGCDAVSGNVNFAPWLRNPARLDASAMVITPLRVNGVHLTLMHLAFPAIGRGPAQLVVQGQGIASVQLQVFDLSGRQVIQDSAPGNRLKFYAQDASGQPLANGVYLYLVTVRGYDGSVVRSEIQKLVVLR